MATARIPSTQPDIRIEPGILTDLFLEDDTRNPAEPISHRMLAATLLVSVLAHAIILAMASSAAKRDAVQGERQVARPSIQIRFQPPPQPEAHLAENTTVNDTMQSPEPPASGSPAPTDESAPADTSATADNVTSEPDTTPIDTIVESPTTPSLRQPPSLTDLRTAARDRAEQDRRSRVMHPDCLLRERRSAFLDCNEQQHYDFVSAGQNATVMFFTPALPEAPDNASEAFSTTRARVKAAIDMVDNQLGTTQTKKRIMNFP